MSGNVSLYHGDCFEVMASLEAGSVDMILVDTPFGTTKNRNDTMLDLSRMWAECKRLIRPHGAIVHFASHPYTAMLVMAHRKGYKHHWVWAKRQSGNFAVAKHMPLTTHEDIVVFTANGEKVNYTPIMRKGKLRRRGSKNSDKHGRGFGGMNQVYYQSDEYYPTSVLEFAAVPRRHSQHPSQKPVDLLVYLIATYAPFGGTVLDFCMGSGSTGVASVKEDRRFVGIEQDGEYFAIAQRRIGEAQARMEAIGG